MINPNIIAFLLKKRIYIYIHIYSFLTVTEEAQTLKLVLFK